MSARRNLPFVGSESTYNFARVEELDGACPSSEFTFPSEVVNAVGLLKSLNSVVTEADMLTSTSSQSMRKGSF